MKSKKNTQKKGRGFQSHPPVFAKKSLGQHFLVTPSYVRAIADAGEVKRNEWVLEIGPGRGALTTELLARGARVIAVEKDSRLMGELAVRFQKEIAEQQLQLIEEDALFISPKKLGLKNNTYKLIANIPYYITGALFEKFLSEEVQPSTIVFLVQKEIAERIARSKKESILSLSVKAYGIPYYIRTVPRGAFSPQPKVDSAILAICSISRKHFTGKTHEKFFFEIVRAGFAHKRKFLVRNLETVLGPKAPEALLRAGIASQARAEDIPLSKWLALALS